jgi:hypothetical protein
VVVVSVATAPIKIKNKENKKAKFKKTSECQGDKPYCLSNPGL